MSMKHYGVIIEIHYTYDILAGRTYIDVAISGDTYEFRDVIKRENFTWDRWSKRWRKSYDDSKLRNLDKATEVPEKLSRIVSCILNRWLSEQER